MSQPDERTGLVEGQPTSYSCDACGKPMALYQALGGSILGCTGYPDCKNAKALDDEGKPIDLPSDEEEVELARLWMKGEEIQCTLRPDVLPAEVWGEVLADMASNVAALLAQGDSEKRRKLLETMKTAFTEAAEERASE